MKKSLITAPGLLRVTCDEKIHELIRLRDGVIVATIPCYPHCDIKQQEGDVDFREIARQRRIIE